MADSKNLWGGRFTGKSDPGVAAFNNSFVFDRRLLVVDVRASIAYAHALAAAGVLKSDESTAITSALEQILRNATSDPDYLNDNTAEDVHSFIESRLVEAIGEVGRKLHTGRSRNDQVATAFRLWVRNAIDDLSDQLRRTQTALLEFAENNDDSIIPGYTHLQRAQPVLLAHWCLAYSEMFSRDRERLTEARRRVNVLPLGSGALSGNSFPIDREVLAADLGFEQISTNSLDAVSDRDFCVEFLGDCSLIMMHLSRLAEDIIIYATTEFGFIQLGDAIATGSSLMPQKKNPDSMELVRGKAGRVFGDLTALLTTLKGLPLAYNKDMQEDKESVFDAFDTTTTCLTVARTVLRNIAVDKQKTRAAASRGYMNATELADYLVRKGIPFRDAHEIVGKIVVRAIDLGKELTELSISELRLYSTVIDEDVFSALTLEQTLASKDCVGGTAPSQVKNAIALARKNLET